MPNSSGVKYSTFTVLEYNFELFVFPISITFTSTTLGYGHSEICWQIPHKICYIPIEIGRIRNISDPNIVLLLHYVYLKTLVTSYFSDINYDIVKHT